MFVLGRAACTCSLYIQGNHSSGPAKKGVNALGRNGDARFVFGIFKGGGTTRPTEATDGRVGYVPILGCRQTWAGDTHHVRCGMAQCDFR